MANGDHDQDRAPRSSGEQDSGRIPGSRDRRSWDPGNYGGGEGEVAGEAPDDDAKGNGRDATDDAGRWKRGSGYYGSRGQTEPEHDEDAAAAPEASQADKADETGSAGAFRQGAFRTTAPPPPDSDRPEGSRPGGDEDGSGSDGKTRGEDG